MEDAERDIAKQIINAEKEEKKESAREWSQDVINVEGRYCPACQQRPCMCSDPF